MKEITRIHIAKVAYDIEVTAKKELEKYMAALERYAEDQEILDDIEIRVTELLAERGVAKNGVITSADVAAVRKRLGEPSDFAPETAEAALLESEAKRVYRDTDHAIVGGVLAGFGRFFGIDPLWVRLIFVVLLLASFGAALVVYALLWLIIPPARTAAEKLQMQGKPVTLEAIKAMAGDDEMRSQAAQTTRRALRITSGVLLVLLGVVALIGTCAAVAAVLFGFGSEYSPIAEWGLHSTWWFVAMMGLFAAAGVLFAALCLVLANALLRRVWSKRTGVVVASIIAAGLVAFAGGMGVAMVGSLEEQGRLQAARQTTSVDLPAAFAKIKTLTVATDENLAGYGRIEYIVASQPRYELEALPGVKPQITIADDGQSATVQLAKTSGDTWRPWHHMSGSVLKLYGPALEAITAKNGQTVHYENDKDQPQLAVAVHEGAAFELSGRYDTVKVASQPGATTLLGIAAIRHLQVNTTGGELTAGVVRTLEVQQADVCGADGDDDNTVQVRAVSSGSLLYNGKQRTAQTLEQECGEVIIGSDDE